MIKVLLVDDHELVALGIQGLLNAAENIEVIKLAESGEQAIIAMNELLPDVVLIDVKMPGMGGAEASRRILAQHPNAKIIGISGYDDAHTQKEFFKIGALGFLSKNSTTEAMVIAIKTVIAGKYYLCPEMQNRKSPFSKLSPRESEVISLILKGTTVQTEIGRLLDVSRSAVGTYRSRAYEKLDVRNDVELIELARKFNH